MDRDTSRIRRFAKGVFASGFGQAVTLVTQIVGIPLFLKFWGAETYGHWLLLSTLPSFLSMSDLSVGTAAGNTMTVLVAAGEREQAKKVYQSAWILVAGISMAVGMLAIGAIWVIPIERILQVSYLGHGPAAVIVSILILQLIVAQQGGIFGSAYRCDGFFAVSMVATNLLRLTEFCSIIVVLICHGGFLAVAMTVLIVRCIGFLVIYWHVSRKVPWLKLGVELWDWNVIKPTIGPAMAFNAFPLGMMLNLQGSVYIIGLLFGPVAVTLFNTARTLSRVVLQASMSLTNSMWVEFSTAFGANDIPLARRLHRRLCQLGVWVCVAGSLALAVVGPWLYGVWTRHKSPLDVPMFDILLAVVAVNSLWNCSYTVPMSINRHQRLALEYLGVMAAGLGVAYLFGQSFGLRGVAISLVLSEITMNVITLRTSLPMVQDTLGPFLEIVSKPPLRLVYERSKTILK